MNRTLDSFVSEFSQQLTNLGIDYRETADSLLINQPNKKEIAFLKVQNEHEFIAHGGQYRLIRVWEDQVLRDSEIVRSRLNSLIGISTRIHARETRVRKIDQPTLTSFLETNHLNVAVKSKIKYGLYNQDQLVAVGAFSKACPVTRNGITYRSHELIRYCSLLNTTVVGGLSKLLKHFIREHDPEDIMTYVDREWSDGSGYEKLGFEVVGRTSPQTFYVSETTHKRYYSKHEAIESEGTEVILAQVANLGNLKMIKLLV